MIDLSLQFVLSVLSGMDLLREFVALFSKVFVGALYVGPGSNRFCETFLSPSRDQKQANSKGGESSDITNEIGWGIEYFTDCESDKREAEKQRD